MMDFLLASAAKLHAWTVLRGFLRATRRASRTQARVLLEKVRRCADSDFGREHGFADIASYADFARRVPILRYEDLSPYVRRVMSGETSAMFGPKQKVLMFAMTSGTTDAPKYVPVTEEFLKDYRRGWNVFGVKALIDHPRAFLRPIVQVTSRMDEETTPAGVPCGAITGIMAATQKSIVRKYYAIPPCVAYVEEPAARYYTTMRLAVPKNAGFMITANPATQLKLARIADQRAERLIRDVRDGTLDASLEIPPAVREELAPRLKADPRRAAQLEAIAARAGRLLPKDYWNLGFVANWTGGTMGLYLRDFSEYFGQTPVRDIGLLASEGRMSIPLEDGTPCGVLDVVANFYEFIPEAEYGSNSPTVLLPHELHVGGDYFILLTTSAGFYRYDIGDRVRVHGFFGEAPVIEFLDKGAHTSSLAGEKLTECQVVLAYERACLMHDRTPGSIVLAAQWADTPYYRLHVEQAPADPAGRWPELENAMDEQLGCVNMEYANRRQTGRLGPLRINVLPSGYLDTLDTQQAAAYRKVNEQYKHKYLYPTPGQDAAFPLTSPVPQAERV